MKKSIFSIFIVSFLLLFSWSGNVLAGKSLVDNFSSGYLEGTTWWPREGVRHIENGKFVAKLGNSSGMGAEVEAGIFIVSLPFVAPDNIHTMQADITPKEVRLDQQGLNTESYAMIGGYFYNVNDVAGRVGDIWAEVGIGDLGNGLEAFWAVVKILSTDPLQLEFLGEGTFNLGSPVQLNVPVTAKISYDGNKTFELSLDDQSATFVGQEDKKSDPQMSFKALMVELEATDGSDTGYISATFDNVYINNSSEIYDDFSATTIDQSKWNDSEFVREVANGRLQSVLKRTDSTRSVDTYLVTKDTLYFEAIARIDSDTQLSDGASCIARLQGYYYNESRGPGSGYDYNAYEGDVFAQIRIQYWSDGTLNARAFVGRSDSSDESEWSNLSSHTFATPITLDTDYTLSINYANNQLVFKCDDETYVYPITTPQYSPYGEHRGLRSRLYLDQGEHGYLKTQFDNVYVGTSPLVDAITDLKILSGMPWTAEDVIPMDFDHNGKIGVADAVASLQLAGGLIQIVEHSSMRYEIHSDYPGDYAIAIEGYEPYTLESFSGPNIVHFWQFNETHWLVNLSIRPSTGDIYNFQYRYPDDTVKNDTYTISTVGDNFAFIISPSDGAVVDSDSFPITWQPASGTVDHYNIIVNDDTGNTIWWANSDPGATSTTFNYDNTATSTLQQGKNYEIALRSYGENGNQATTVSTFWFLTKPPEYNVMIEHYYPESYFIGVRVWGDVVSAEIIDGPDIASTSEQRAHLQDRPDIGDTYTIRLDYSDGSNQNVQYVVTTINDNFAFIVSPSNGAVVDSDSFPITWQPASGTVDHYLILVHDDTGNGIWRADFDPDATATTFNYDNTATSTLQTGKNYTIYLHSYDENGNQATTVSTFSFPEHSSMRYTIQSNYPGGYAIAIDGYEPYTLESASGPNIVHFWQFNETHWLVNLSTKPSTGDIYSFHYRYPDDSVDNDTYTISTINDNFAFITNPVDGSTIDTTTPTFSWSEASEIQRYSLIIEKQISDSDSVFVWYADLPPETTSAVYDFDATAVEPLSSGYDYTINLRTFDPEGHQADTGSTFSVELP